MGLTTPTNRISTVTPFTYRDGSTFLHELELLKKYLKQLADYMNTVITGNQAEVDHVISEMNELAGQLNNALVELDARWKSYIEALEVEGAPIFDPTNGTRLGAEFRVLNNMYDYLRVFAYFAQNLDDFGYTAEEWDAFGMTARHFDIAPQHTINDVFGVAIDAPIGEM